MSGGDAALLVRQLTEPVSARLAGQPWASEVREGLDFSDDRFFVYAAYCNKSVQLYILSGDSLEAFACAEPPRQTGQHWIGANSARLQRPTLSSFHSPSSGRFSIIPHNLLSPTLPASDDGRGPRPA